MNNISQKNVIYGLRSEAELPYQQVQYINHKECCENINEVDVNNLANQLLDNDLYVESFLQHASSYIVGPKIYDSTTISSKTDGYKAFGQIKTSQSLEILHKTDKPLSASVSRLQTGNVKYLKKFGDLIIANIGHATKCSYDPVNGPWENLLCCDEHGCRLVDSNDAYTNGVDCFIAADTGIYQLSTCTNFDESVQAVVEAHSLVKLNNDASNINARCIAASKDGSQLYVGCDGGEEDTILVGSYNKNTGIIGNKERVSLVPKNLYFDHAMVQDQINDIEILSGGCAVVAGNESLYFQTNQKYLQNNRILKTFIPDIAFKSSIQYNGRVFFSSSNHGLWYKSSNTKLTQITSIGETANIVKMVVGNDKLYVATPTQIFSINQSFDARLDQESPGGIIQSIASVGRSVLIATTTGLWSYDGSIKDPYKFLVKPDITDAKDLLFNNGYLALAGDHALSVMHLSTANDVQLPIISRFDEVPVPGIDGSSGESGFLKFINVKDVVLAVFKTKVQSLGADKAVFNSPYEIQNAIALDVQNSQDGHFIVATSNSTLVFKYDGTKFETTSTFSEISGLMNLAQIEDVVVGSGSDNYISAWSLANINFGHDSQWIAMSADSSFDDIEACGLCAICQIGQSGLSAYSKVSIATKFSDDIVTDACADSSLSTQFIASGTSRAKAYIVSAMQVDGEGFFPEFSIVNIGGANAKRIEVTQFFGNDLHYAYVLNAAGNIYLYQLEQQFDGDGILTGFTSTLIFKTTNVMTDLQSISCGLYGREMLFSSSTGTYTHGLTYSTPATLVTGSFGDIQLDHQENEDGSSPRDYLVYSQSRNIKSRDLESGDTTTTLTCGNTIKKFRLGLVGTYALNAYDLTMTYTSGGTTESHIMQFNTSDARVVNFEIKSVWFKSNKKSYDAIIAAIGHDLHVVVCDGNAEKDFYYSTKELTFAEDIISIDQVEFDDDISYFAVCTTNSIWLLKLTLTSDEFGCSAKLEAQDHKSVAANSAYFEGPDKLVYATGNSVHSISLQSSRLNMRFATSDEITLVGPILGVDLKLFKESRIDGRSPDFWLYDGSALESIATGEKISFSEMPLGIVVDHQHGMFIATPTKIYKTTRQLVASGLSLHKAIPGLQSASYANGLVFVAGPVGLSCYNYNDPSAPLTCLNSTTSFSRCCAQIANSNEIDLIAWNDGEIYQKRYTRENIQTNSFNETSLVKNFSNVIINTVIPEKDQLIATIEENGGTTFRSDNIFLAMVNAREYEDFVVACTTGIYGDMHDFSLKRYPPDSTTKIVEFADLDQDFSSLAYIPVDEKFKIKDYVSNEVLLARNASTSFMKARRDGTTWYYKLESDNKWHYLPYNNDQKELQEFQSNTIDNLNGISTDKYGKTYFGTEYGILSATYLKSAVVGETVAYPLTQNFSWTGNLQSLNRGVGYTVVVASSNGATNNLYKVQLRSQDGSLIQFSPPSTSTGLETTAELTGVWCVNNDYSRGVFCKATASDLDKSNYAKWLNEVVGDTLLPYTNVEGNGVGGVFKYDDRYYLLSGSSIVNFSRYGDDMVFERVASSITSRDPYSHLVPIAADRLIAVGNTGLMLYSAKYSATLKNGDGIGALTSYILDGRTRFMHNMENAILTSTNYKVWKPLLTLPENVKVVNDVECLNKKTYLFATPNGLYGTKYAFTLTNDIQPISKENALSIYNELIASKLSNELSAAFDDHLSTHHLSSSLITRLNEDYSTIQLDDVVSSWQKVVVSSQNAFELGIKNDVIAEMTFGSQADGDVIVQISNYLDDEDSEFMEEVSAASYITKRWMSGLTEIFINVPTTRTYYLNNLYGASNCRVSPDTQMTRKNLEEFGVDKMDQTGILSDHYTLLQVGLASAEYSIDNLVDVQINGMSLPLKIYQEQSSQDNSGFAGRLYRSFIEPSVLKSYDLSKTDDEGNWLFKFACFGTDAQAIHLMFYDEKARSNAAVVKVVFDPNGGEGAMAAQKFIIVEDENGYPTLEQKNLKRNKFTNTSAGYEKIFAGWSITPLPDNEEATYEDKMVFPFSTTWADLHVEIDRDADNLLMHKDQITLYAVWLTYQFSEDDTTLVFNSNKTEFAIDQVGVDESTNLKDTVIIDFGD